MANTVILTGSFDPPTYGHRSILFRAAMLFKEITIVVCSNLDKKHMFSHQERLVMVKAMVDQINFDLLDLAKVNVDELKPGHMLSSYIQDHKSEVLVRGLRNGLDLEYERSIEEFVREYGIRDVVYLLNDPDQAVISSSLVRNHLLVMRETQNVDTFIFRYIPSEVVSVMMDTSFGGHILNRSEFVSK